MAREPLRTAIWFVVAGALTLIRELVGLSDPAYYDPVTAPDYTAGWGFPDSGGLWLAGAAPVGMGLWLLTSSPKVGSDAP